MTIKKFLSDNKKKFSQQDLEFFLQKVLNCDKKFLFLNENFSIPKEKILELEKFLEEKKQWFSVASIIWEKNFYWRKFFIDKNVLVPREETEDMIAFLQGKIWWEFYLPEKKNFLDIWTWSGVIPITLILNMLEKETEWFFDWNFEVVEDILWDIFIDEDEKNEFNKGVRADIVTEFYSKNIFYASDISEKALKVAKKNAKNFWVKIKFFQLDLLKNLPKKLKNEGIFLITANLPYVEEKIKTDKTAKVDNWISMEPDLALYSWEDGLQHYLQLFEELKDVKFKYLIMEMAPWQTDKIAKLYSYFWKTQVYLDLGGKKRGVFLKSQ